MSFNVGKVLPDQFPGVPQRLSGPLSFQVLVTAGELPARTDTIISEKIQIALPDISVLLPSIEFDNHIPASTTMSAASL
jgi:hypothetical protein